MTDTPRCGQPVKNYQLRRPPDRMDVVLRDGSVTVPCFRPKGHPGDRHQSEASYKRCLALAALRKRAWRRARKARQRENVGPR
jgi:hypothetical protein